YCGADSDFTLYEDESDNYNYEKSAYATIAFHWDDAKQTLTISERKKQFPSMLTDRTFHIVLVRKNHSTGIAAKSRPDSVVRYAGKEIKSHWTYEKVLMR